MTGIPINRRIPVAGITDRILLSLPGRCSVDVDRFPWVVILKIAMFQWVAKRCVRYLRNIMPRRFVKQGLSAKFLCEVSTGA
jgi:hypothetical protein